MGGLCDGLCTVPFIAHLVKALPDNCSLAETLLSSSYTGFGSSSLGQDVSEIAECVSYFRNQRPDGNIILMGHSTGSQDVMHYLLSPGERPLIDGGIMQGSVSDREAMETFMIPELLYQSVKLAQQYVKEGKGNDVLPDHLTNTIFPAPVSAKRWLSLASPAPDHTGEDDYFSSDFDDKRLSETFGKLGEMKTPILILFGEKDQYVPNNVDRVQLVNKWKIHIKKGGGMLDEGSGVIPGMSHNVKELGAPLEDLTTRVSTFVANIEKQKFGDPSKQGSLHHCPWTGIQVSSSKQML